MVEMIWNLRLPCILVSVTPTKIILIGVSHQIEAKNLINSCLLLYSNKNKDFNYLARNASYI